MFLTIVWVGGMFFAYLVLRHAVVELEPAPERLKLWARTFKKFFPWVWMSVIGMPVTGHMLIGLRYEGGLAATPVHIHWMIGLGYAMIGIYLALQFLPYRKFKAAIADEAWLDAKVALDRIRRLVATNLWIGITTALIAVTGPLWAWLPGS